jgi:hypothetical protein
VKIILQRTNGAFGSTQDIPENQWHNGREYRKVATAHKGLQEAIAEMRRICGPSAWDRHFRLINAGVLPIKLSHTFECYGSYWTHQHHPECHVSVTVEQMWEPGEPKPRVPSVTETHGWHSNTCPACNQLDTEHDSRQRERYALEQGWAN